MILLLIVAAVVAFAVVICLLHVSVHDKECLTQSKGVCPLGIPVRTVSIGVTNNRIFRAGHVSLQLEYENGTILLVHKEPNGRVVNYRAIWNMIRYGHRARIEFLHFPDRQHLEVFQKAFQWRFSRIFLENPQAVAEYVYLLMNSHDLGAPTFCFAGRNCVDFVADLLKVGHKRDLPYHPIPMEYFDKVASLGRQS